MSIEYIKKFIGDHFANGDKQDTLSYCQQIGSLMWPFHWHIYIWTLPILKVKVMHISTEHFSQTMTFGPNIAIANTYEVECGISTDIFTSDIGPLKSTRSRSCILDCEYLVGGDRWAKIAIANKLKSHTAFPLAYLHFTQAHFKGRGKGYAHLHLEYLTNGDGRSNYCCFKQKGSRIRPFG